MPVPVPEPVPVPVPVVVVRERRTRGHLASGRLGERGCNNVLGLVSLHLRVSGVA